MHSNVPISNHSVGPQNVAAGNGPQNNNQNGQQFINSRFYGVNPFKDQQADEAQKLQKEKEDCLRSLGFPNIDARQNDIAAAHPHTCNWLFTTTEFQKWRHRTDLPTHNGVLWIKGKPGAGKSTLMKHTFHQCQKVFYDHLIVAYFFNARGEILEKTPLGMLRSIIYQLLDKDIILYEHFVPIFRKKKRMHGEEGWEWQQSELKEFVRLEINQWKSKPLLLLIDALDECNEPDVRDVVGFLESWSINAIQAGVTLRICLSSRHYPNISMGKTLELTVEKSEKHRGDIAIYAKEKLRIQNNNIEAEIRKKADGIFMWVVIVISLLNKAYDEGRVEAMQKTLEEVPTDLEKVFNTLLSKHDQYKAETILILQWVLLSERPLKPEELYFAMVIGITPENAGRWNRSYLTSDIIQRRITSSSKGLIEVRKGYAASVQFIHLSVRDFLLRNKRLQSLDQNLEPDPISATHGRLWACCLIYIEQAKAILIREQKRELGKDFPFLEYAARYILDHAEKALSGGVQRKAIKDWLQNQNDWFGWWKTFLHTAAISNTSSFLEGNTDAGLLYTLSRGGYRNLVRILLETGADVNAQCGGEYGNALQAASAGGHQEIVRILLEKGADANAQCGGGFHGNALQAVSAGGHQEIVRILLEKGADANAQSGGLYGNALQAASAGGHQEIVRMLLKKGADANAQGGREYGNALEAASARGHQEIVRILLENGADVNARGGGVYGNALQAASARGHQEIVRILLENGADVNVEGGGVYGNALQAASARVRILPKGSCKKRGAREHGLRLRARGCGLPTRVASHGHSGAGSNDRSCAALLNHSG